MADSLKQRIWAFPCATFPERQIYIRSDGRVQFFVFGPLMQVIMASITLLFLGWVAFTSVNVVFKDRIITAKDNRFAQMQASYESRVADLQLSYDELNSAVVTTEDHMQSLLDDFQSKQETLANLVQDKQDLERSIGIAQPKTAIDAAKLTSPPASVVPQIAESIGAGANDGADSDAGRDPQDSQDALTIIPPGGIGGANQDDALVPPPSGPDDPPSAFSGARGAGSASPAAEPHAPQRESFLHGAVDKLTGALFGHHSGGGTVRDNPLLATFSNQEREITRMQSQQLALLTALGGKLDAETTRIEKGLKLTGIKPQTLIARATKSPGGVGGPLIPLPSSFAQAGQGVYVERLANVTNALGTLTTVVKATRTVPLIAPVEGDGFDISSGFGVRRDPFTEKPAFHAGLDFSGPRNSPVHATAPGVVVFAGPRGSYGNTVEIDHGNGIRTRYGHLRAILVKVGEKLQRGAVIGKLGSTGRSTGPHVHYEVWYDNTVRNPRKFLKAGHYVLQE